MVGTFHEEHCLIQSFFRCEVSPGMLLFVGNSTAAFIKAEEIYLVLRMGRKRHRP
jgi:hypothetical protein